MTDTRKNLKLNADTFQRLKNEKGDYETWDGLMHRLLDGIGHA